MLASILTASFEVTRNFALHWQRRARFSFTLNKSLHIHKTHHLILIQRNKLSIEHQAWAVRGAGAGETMVSISIFQNISCLNVPNLVSKLIDCHFLICSAKKQTKIQFPRTFSQKFNFSLFYVYYVVVWRQTMLGILILLKKKSAITILPFHRLSIC